MLQMEQLFGAAVREAASDLLIVANAPPILRINGKLMPLGEEPLKSTETERLIYSLLTADQKKSFEEEKSLDFGFCYWDCDSPDQWIQRFRVNVFKQQGFVSGAFRAIPNHIPSLDDLGLPPIIESLADEKQGLILVTGPTGHGKSTTLAALVDTINTHRSEHIITIEDPVEYMHPHKNSIIEQREIGRDTPTFISALRYILRQDPDVILVGEMRDKETITCVLTAAETGHLVLTTLHTNDSVQAIERIIDIYPAEQQKQVRLQLALSLTAVLAQRLLPRADQPGRVVCCEVLLNNDAVANLIREGKTHQIYAVVETRSREGMITFDQALKDLFDAKLIDFDTARVYMKKPERLIEAT